MKTLTLAKIATFAVTLAALFAFAACPTEGVGDPDSDPGGGNYSNDTITIENGVSTLKLSGQVYTESFNQNGNISYAPYTGSKAIPPSYGGVGAITDGMFSYSIGVPDNLEPFFENDDMMHIFADFEYDRDGNLRYYNSYYNNLQCQPANIKCYVLREFEVDKFYDSDTSYWETLTLVKGNITGNLLGNRTQEAVYYVYVDSDVTVSGAGKATTWTNSDANFSSTTTTTTTNLNLVLKKGWNAIYGKGTTTRTSSSPSSETFVGTLSMSLHNPNLRWGLYQGWYYN